jgi:hypothetical protein
MGDSTIDPDKSKMIRADQALEFVYLKYGANVVHSLMGALLLVLFGALWNGLVEDKHARFSMIWVFLMLVIVAIVGISHAVWTGVKGDKFNKAEREMAKEEGRHSELLGDDSSLILTLIFVGNFFIWTLGPVVYKWVFYYYTFWGETVIPGVGPSGADYGF